MNDKLAVNFNVLENLKALMDAKSFSNLIASFLERSQKHIESIHVYIKGKDLKQLHLCVHSLKGSSANLGCQRLSARCAEFENTLKNAEYNIEEFEQQLLKIEVDYQSAKQALQQYLNPDNASDAVA